MDKKMDYFYIPSLENQRMELNRLSSYAASVVSEGHASPSAGTVVDISDDDDDVRNSEDAFCLDVVKRGGVKRRSNDYQGNSCAKKRKVTWIIVKVFNLAAELII